MYGTHTPVIDLTATGENIRCLRISHHLTVRKLQEYFGFSEPRVIYKWQKGECLPSLESLLGLSRLFRLPIEKIVIMTWPDPDPEMFSANKEQQTTVCCSDFLNGIAA